VNLAACRRDQVLMRRVNVLSAAALLAAGPFLGFWIGQRWFPPFETEVVEGLRVERLCRTWTDGCNWLVRDKDGVRTTAMYCMKPKQYRCTSYSWW